MGNKLISVTPTPLVFGPPAPHFWKCSGHECHTWSHFVWGHVAGGLSFEYLWVCGKLRRTVGDCPTGLDPSRKMKDICMYGN